MGRVLRFTRPHNASTPQARYPRFTEVTAHISHLADQNFEATSTLQQGRAIYRELEQRLAPADREQLKQFYDMILRHEEKFEHAAYLVGLAAGSGQLLDALVFTDERRASGESS
jgi:hypothetical protein